MITTAAWSIAHLLTREIKGDCGLMLSFRQDPNAISDAVHWPTADLPFELRIREGAERGLEVLVRRDADTWNGKAEGANFFGAKRLKSEVEQDGSSIAILLKAWMWVKDTIAEVHQARS